MEYSDTYVIIDTSLDCLTEPAMGDYITHAYCLGGKCEIWYNDACFNLHKGDSMIIVANRSVTKVVPSPDFQVKVIYVEMGFLQVCAPHSNYGTRGGLSLYIDPIMRLNEDEQRRCERDFDDVFHRVEHPHKYFHGDEMSVSLQLLFIDFFEFHSRIYGDVDLSAQTTSVMNRFVDMLDNGDYKKSREVAYFASELCVSPKYLSEVCKKVSGYSANYWINRYAAIEISHLLKDRTLSLTDISDIFGFSSLSHFSRFVQNNLGASPSSFRE